MPTTPTTSLALRRPDLRDTLEEFSTDEDQNGFVGLKIAPVLEVQKQSGSYGVIPLKESLKSRDTRRADDGSYSRGAGKGTPDNYQTDEHGHEEPVDDREAERYASWWNAEALAVKRCRDAVLRNHNQRVIDAALGISNTTAAGTAWSTHASADPRANVLAAKVAVRGRTGLVPNALALDWEAWEHVQQVDALLNLLKYSGHDDPKKITPAMVAAVFDLDEVIISGSVKNTANEAKAAVVGSMWTKTKACLFVKSQTLDLRVPQFMRTFHWGSDGSAIGGVIETYRSEERRSDIVRCRMDTQEKKVYENAAQVITGVL